MKKLLLLSIGTVLLFAFLYGCSDKPTENENNQARMVITAFDSPAPEGVEHLYLNIIEVSVHHEDEGWITMTDVDTTVDFLELINGVSVVLADDSVPTGYYSQLRLVVSDTNEIVVKDKSHPLTIPSGTQTGVKLNLDFSLDDGEFVNLYVDFDVAKSVLVASDVFMLKPTYRVFKETLSGTIAGTVTDTLNNPVAGVTIYASELLYSTSTITNSMGNYLLTLPFGLYEIRAMIDSASTTDTTYTGVSLNAGDNLTGYDFVIW